MATENWNNLVPKDLLIDIVQRSTCPEDYYRFSAVCKSWNSAAYEAAASIEESVIDQKPWWLLLRRFPTTIPMLLLAEEVAPGSIIFDTQYDLIRDGGYKDFTYLDEDYHIDSYDYSKNSVGSSRGLYSLSSNKTYNVVLPEAAGKVILSTSKGWLLTLGRDLQINLLHPLFGYKISLPPMLVFPRQYEYNESHTPEDASEYFISKVAMSSSLLAEKKDATLSSIVMTIYGKSDSLGFARLRDKVWTDVNINSNSKRFDDIVYHRGNFYAVDDQGDVYVCCIDSDEQKGGLRGKKIASIDRRNYVFKEAAHQYYLVEPLSGSGLLLIVRYLKRRYFTERGGLVLTKYRTTEFKVWRLDLDYNDSPCLRTSTEESNLGDEAIFVGRASSLSVPSSDIIKPNSIYFTDDCKAYLRVGGGHDMGIFNMEGRTVEPHYQGKSIHCISPPLWYI